MNLAGADKNDVSSAGSNIVVGDPLAIELTVDANGDGALDGPPVAVVRPLFGSESARVVRVRRGIGNCEHCRKER